MVYRLLRFAYIINCEVGRKSPKRFPHSAASLAREANCAGGRTKEAEYAALFRRPTDDRVSMTLAWSSVKGAPRLPGVSRRRMRHEPAGVGPVAHLFAKYASLFRPTSLFF
jgi:hypothetical protein